MKYILNLVIIFQCINPVIAKEVDLTKINNILENRLELINKIEDKHYSISSESKIFYSETGEKAAYIQNLDPQGFIIISAHEEMVPVLGYSLTHNFNWEEHPDNIMYQLLKKDIKLRIKIVENKSIKKTSNKWDILSAENMENYYQNVWPSPGTTETGGWVETLWHQSKPFNARCPYDNVNNGKCYVGCVATAMSQIVNYFEYPASLSVFSNAYDYTSSYKDFTFNLDDDCGTNGTLTWSQLNYALRNITYPLYEETDEGLIDEFCFACGVSVQMKYSAEGSGSATSKVANALKNTFDYQSAEWKKSTDPDFFPTLKANMINAQPAEMSIRAYNPVKGHAIVVDGFDEAGTGSDDDLYHLNYGWGSQSYCYWWNLLPADNVDPELPHEYEYAAGAVVNIYPGGNFITIKNIGGKTLTINNITVDRDWLTVTPPSSLPISLSTGENLKLSTIINDWNKVNYPSENATISIYSDDPENDITTAVLTAHPKSSVDIEQDSEHYIPEKIQLCQNYPNPFNPQTKIKFALNKPALLNLTVYNIKGEIIYTLVDGFYQAGEYDVTWEGKTNSGVQVANGVYFYTLKTGSFVEVKKCIFMK